MGVVDASGRSPVYSVNSSIGLEAARLWATEWRDVCRTRLDAIEARLAALENPLEEFRDNWYDI